MTVLSALDYDTLNDLVLAFKLQKKPFYFEADCAPGVTVVANWEDETEVDEPTQLLQVHVDAERVGVRYVGPAYDRPELDLMGPFFDKLDDELGTMMDLHFRHAIRQWATGPLMFMDEWSDESTHVFSVDVPIRREEGTEGVTAA